MGQYFFKIDDKFLPLTGGTVSGNTYISANLSADTLNFVNIPNNDDSLTEILARNSTTGEIEYRDVQSIISAATAQDTYVTGGTFNDISNELTLKRNDSFDIIISGFTSSSQFGLTYFVAPEGDDLTGEYGNISKPFKTITGARNQLLVDSLSGQTLIYVFPGTYDEAELQYPNGKMYLSPGSLIKPSAKIEGAGAAMNAVNQGTKTFTFNGNWATYLNVGKKFRVVGGANDGTYTIASATDVGGTTEVVVSEPIPSASVGGKLRNNETVFTLGSTPLNAPSGSASNNFELYGEGDIDIVKSLDDDWSGGIVTAFGSAEFYGEAVTWRQEKGVLMGGYENSKMTFNGSTLELYGNSGYVTTARDSSDTTFNFDRIISNGSYTFLIRYGSNPTFNGSCVVTSNVIKAVGPSQAIGLQRMGPGGRVVINSPIVESDSFTLNAAQNSGGELILNGNIVAGTPSGSGIVTGLDFGNEAKFTINGNITTDSNRAFWGVGTVNSSWYLNGNIESISGSADPILDLGAGSGSVNLNGSVKNTDGGTALNGISTGGVSIVVENLEVTADNETITSSSPQTVEILHSLSINNPLGSNITTNGLFNYTGTTNVGDLVIYNTPINNESPNKVLTHNLDGSIGTTSVSGLTLDTYIISGNADAATSQLDLTNNTGGTFTVTNSAALFSDNDINVTGGTYNMANGCVTFATNSGTTFDVCGFVTGITDSYTTGATLLANTLIIKRNNGLSDVDVDLSSLSASTPNLQNVLDQGSSATIASPLYIGVPGYDLTLFTGGVLDLSADEATFFFSNSGEMTSQNGNLSFNANNGEINLSANDTVNVSSDLDVVGDVTVTGGTGNINSKQVYVEGNLALDWDFSNNSISLGNPTDPTLIKGSELFVDTNTFVNGNLSANTIYSGSTDLYDIFTTEDNDTFYWTTGSTGSYSIRVLNDTSVDATGDYALAEGSSTASGDYSHAEGNNTIASGNYSHSEGYGGKGSVVASGEASHAEGFITTAAANYSHAEGDQTSAEGIASHAEGSTSISVGTASHAEGFGTTSNGANSHAEGQSTIASGQSSHSEGTLTTALLNYSHAEGFGTIASGIESHAEGYETVASGEDSHAEGLFTTSSGNYSHAEGWTSTASGEDSHAEGFGAIASGADSHAQGLSTTANNTASHAEGFSTTSAGISSHAEGFQVEANADASHAEGYGTTAQGLASHAEGFETTSEGSFSHAGGSGSIASGATSFVHSTNSLASGDRSVVLGGQNITGTTDDTVYVPYLNINNLSTGTSVNTLAVDSSGNVVVDSSSSATTFTVFNTSPTSPDPKNIYDDGYIRIWFDESSSDDVECEVLINPSAGKVHFSWDEPSDGTAGASDVDISSGVVPLNNLFDNDDRMNITVWAPSDTAYPYYEMKITKSNSTYTSVPAVIRVNKWNSPT